MRAVSDGLDRVPVSFPVLLDRWQGSVQDSRRRGRTAAGSVSEGRAVRLRGSFFRCGPPARVGTLEGSSCTVRQLSLIHI